MASLPHAPFQKTLDAKPNDMSIVKPGELVDVVEMSPLTLNDRRIFNLLLANAWDGIGETRAFSIDKASLQTSGHKGTDRLEDSIRRLMSAIVEVRVSKAGKWRTRRVQLLGANTIPDGSQGTVEYEFPRELCEIVRESTVFARLHKQIMFALSSKYALALYEMVQKRGNLNKTMEDFTLDELRGFLGVPKGKLDSWGNLKMKAITPAVREVSDLSEFEVTVEPLKGGTRRFTHVRLGWRRKGLDEIKGVARELSYSKVGRKARRLGAVEPLADTHSRLAPATLSKARKLLRGRDVHQLEADWRDLIDPTAATDDAFLEFCAEQARSER